MTNTAADLSTRGLGFVDMANRWLGPGGRPSRCLVFATRCGTKAPICRVPDQASKDSSVMGTCCTCMAIEAFGCKFPWPPPPLSIVIAPHVSCLLHRLLHRQTEWSHARKYSTWKRMQVLHIVDACMHAHIDYGYSYYHLSNSSPLSPSPKRVAVMQRLLYKDAQPRLKAFETI